MARKTVSRLLMAAMVAESTNDIKNCKRSELPIYIPEPIKKVEKKPAAKSTPAAPVPETVDRSYLEDVIRSVRQTINKVKTDVVELEKKGITLLQEGKDQGQWLINYLGEPDNTAPKAPAIAIGGLTGLILGLRGGLFRKVLFTSAGALGMASICYPKEAAEYGAIAVAEGKQYAKIGYNFIYGVKKGDPPLELPSLPKFPGSISEAWSMATVALSSDTPSVTEKECLEVSDDEVELELLMKCPPEEVEVAEVEPPTETIEEEETCTCPIDLCEKCCPEPYPPPVCIPCPEE